VSDHLASLRVAIEGNVVRHIDYDPWGNIISGGGAAGERLMFNVQERDLENGLYDLSDRNLDATGAFTRPDRLWEKLPAWSPYHYSYANPVWLTDPTGMQSATAVPIYKEWMESVSGIIGTPLSALLSGAPRRVGGAAGIHGGTKTTKNSKKKRKQR